MATADNIALNPARGGPNARAKGRGGNVFTQLVGLDLNPGGSTEVLMAAGQQVASASLPVVVASDQPPLAVVGSTALLAAAPPTNSPDYAAGDCVGGKLTLPSAVRVVGGTAVLQSLLLIDAADQQAALDLFLFDADPASAGTALTDNLPLALAAGDLGKVLCRVRVSPSDYATAGGVAYASLGSLGRVLRAAAGQTTLYLALAAVDAPSYPPGVLSLRLGLLRD